MSAVRRGNRPMMGGEGVGVREVLRMRGERRRRIWNEWFRAGSSMGQWAGSREQPKLRNDGVKARSEWERNGWEDLAGPEKSGRAKAKQASEWMGRRNERGEGGGGAGLFGWPG